MPRLSENFIAGLPSPEGARAFLERLRAAHPEDVARYRKNPSLLAHLLVLATHSPFLGETVLTRRDYIAWLEREKDIERIKSKEELFEELARFAAVHSEMNEQSVLAGFKRREWLRIYLRDCLRLATLTETTLELSNLADVILQHALWHSLRDLLNRYGRPQVRDSRGRINEADFAIVALGKLGSQELNYASDIDLLYLYSHNGVTSGGEITNKEFFTKLAERITRTVSGVGDDGAVYRIDLRLRPRGREGDLVVSLDEAVAYYHRQAHLWERQALIRARAAAGSHALVARFVEAVRPAIYRAEPLDQILDAIRWSKEKIDHEVEASGKGIDVKLNRGGIREIEFIVQALQLFYGAADPWVRHPQILIGLQRLADKGILSDTDRVVLSEAYTFLRTVEHRLQMEHGVRTHTVPSETEKVRLLARRMGYNGGDEAARFLDDLQRHRQNVATIFDAVFQEKVLSARDARAGRPTSFRPHGLPPEPTDEGKPEEALIGRALDALAVVFPRHHKQHDRWRTAIATGLERALNPQRAVNTLSAYAESLAATVQPETERRLAEEIPTLLPAVLQVFGVSHFFSQILIANPMLIEHLPTQSENTAGDRDYYLGRFRGDLTEGPTDLAARMRVLRRRWYREILAIGYRDITGQATLRQVNREQSALASAALEIAFEIAREDLWWRYGRSGHAPVFTVLGLGRLGHHGVDYGSDLDVIVVYDDGCASPFPDLQPQEAYARLVALVIHILSTITQDGYLYRVDLRLRPGGTSGPLAHPLSSFRQYLEARAATWERLAYVKAFPVAGDAAFGRRVHEEMQDLILRPRPTDETSLVADVREMRDRLQREKGGPQPARNFKFGPGGMMDVYFATRYLQLRHQIREPDERGTLPLLDHLRARGVLSESHHGALYAGYLFLRRLDHALRLLFDRPTETLPANRSALTDLATFLGYASPSELEQAHDLHRREIRAAYDGLVR